LRFNTVYALSIGLNLVLLPLFVEVLKIHPLISQACLTIMIVVISYIGHRNFSFRREAK
jgi:putative flippase GtrA